VSFQLEAEMLRHAERLRDAALDVDLPAAVLAGMEPETVEFWRARKATGRQGADTAALAELEAAFEPWILPAELLTLLSVLGGPPTWEWLFGIYVGGQYLSCRDIVVETESRSDFPDTGWCPAWVVFTSEQHHFAAVVAGAEARARSVVVDLGYGGGPWRVAAASLTSLVAATADAWEQGLVRALDEDVAGHQYTAVRRRLLSLLDARDQAYPSDDGFRRGDPIGMGQEQWPLSWPRSLTPSTVHVPLPWHPSIQAARRSSTPQSPIVMEKGSCLSTRPVSNGSP
jgi:hypothetical protein